MLPIPLLVLVAALQEPAGVGTGSPSRQRIPATREEIERDLAVEVKPVTPDRVQTWWRVLIDARLVNRSRDRSHLVVRPGDGSDAGWREPHVFCTVEVDSGDGVWREGPNQELLRCGNHAADWR